SSPNPRVPLLPLRETSSRPLANRAGGTIGGEKAMRAMLEWQGFREAKGRMRGAQPMPHKPEAMMPTNPRIGPFTPAQATLILIAVTFILRTIGAAVVGWGTGEAYYLASARQFHLSYFDQPPLSLWTIWA